MTLNGNLGISEEEERELGIEDSGNWESKSPIKQTLECDTVLVVTTLYVQLHKLSSLKSEEILDQILTTLWKTRRSGLRPPDKSRFQSLLSFPSLSDLDPVLACLRLLIRKSVHENYHGDDLLKLFLPDLSLDLQSLLVLLLQKYQSQWMEEIAKEQIKANTPPSFTPLPSSDIPTSLWPRQDEPSSRINLGDFGASPIITDAPVFCLAPFSMQHDAGPPGSLEVLPRLKSMTWTMENLNSAPASRVAIIHLKLQDCTNEQLSNMAGTSSEPAQKKQKQ
ncbi:hypothetical protein V6N12_046038 [Hibiscus sabdariffa]|uniref:COMM domain-containing protein n=1 Tax=Hibiscus sabdariffa TaxID=183260 RepID=A0ABR2G579_9ROSI